LDAEVTYNITAPETITVTVPSTALTGGNSVVASPTFQVSPISATSYISKRSLMGIG
jgi:hypothetical protein